jgi:hypothetical protein
MPDAVPNTVDADRKVNGFSLASVAWLTVSWSSSRSAHRVGSAVP